MPTSVTQPDELVAFPWNLEANTARKLIASGAIKAKKIGRKWFALRSEVLKLMSTETTGGAK